ncbi:hypothetical protein HGP16_02750 [Rhizobium sp. P40RR-XXII]|uniref:hypothetical protein n=1 Tax=unclassified Rhizobium TaxID=2613769 RepID=UPI0014568651|nr:MULTISPECIES: hypothetical protein [unclassified Rhizobium]NLR83879.1 hypothetical protein [Rhizobium sp. P28RR-XV]NLS15475.1 hypothetical protein [Rhizobium sp. P40RR-XXII]
MQLIDPSHPLYKPLWVRILIVAVCFGWAAVETFGSQPFWAMLSGALGVYSAWMLLLNFKPQPPAATNDAPARDDVAEDDGPAEDKK